MDLVFPMIFGAIVYAVWSFQTWMLLAVVHGRRGPTGPTARRPVTTDPDVELESALLAAVLATPRRLRAVPRTTAPVYLRYESHL